MPCVDKMGAVCLYVDRSKCKTPSLHGRCAKTCGKCKAFCEDRFAHYVHLIGHCSIPSVKKDCPFSCGTCIGFDGLKPTPPP